MAPNTAISTPSTGSFTPRSELDGPVAAATVHPTAMRQASEIVVRSDRTTYTEDAILACFDYRGADVVRGPNGQLHVTPTVKPFEFKTDTRVAKTGWASSVCRMMLV